MVIVVRHYFRMYTSVSVARKSRDALTIYSLKMSYKTQEFYLLVLHTIQDSELTVWRNGLLKCLQVNTGKK